MRVAILILAISFPAMAAAQDNAVASKNVVAALPDGPAETLAQAQGATVARPPTTATTSTAIRATRNNFILTPLINTGRLSGRSHRRPHSVHQ